jgi:hypothetical protein
MIPILSIEPTRLSRNARWRGVNLPQRIVLGLGLLAVLAIVLFPPWIYGSYRECDSETFDSAFEKVAIYVYANDDLAHVVHSAMPIRAVFTEGV